VERGKKGVAVIKRRGSKKVWRARGEIETQIEIMESQVKTVAKVDWQMGTIKQQITFHHQINGSRCWSTQPVY
jgi:hypothetical protein